MEKKNHKPISILNVSGFIAHLTTYPNDGKLKTIPIL